MLHFNNWFPWLSGLEEYVTCKHYAAPLCEILNCFSVCICAGIQPLLSGAGKNQTWTVCTMNCSFMKIPWISHEKPTKIISWPMNTAKWNFMGLFLALNFPWIRGIFFMTHEFLQSLFLWPIDLPWKSPELISWPMNFFISLLSWPMNFFKVYFHDPLVSPESHQNEFHAHELQSNSISWANNSFVLGEQN